MWLTVLEKMRIPDYAQHQLLWTYFPQVSKSEGAERPFCYLDTGDKIMMLSVVEPSTECIKIEFQAGQTLMFNCMASLTARRYSKSGVVFKPQDYTAEHIKDWFIRKFKDVADINYVTFKKHAPHMLVDSTGRKKRIPLDRTEFFGTLTIVDAEKFSEIIGRGIGGGCAFGFGAMILPQVMK